MRRKIFSFVLLASMISLTSAQAVELTWGGDLRVRQETRFEQGAVVDTQNRNRIRFRYGAKAEVAENLDTNFRFATSGFSVNQGDPLSTNQTYNNFAPYLIYLDQAYITYRPTLIERFKVYAGKMKNPMTTTMLMWDPDTNPDGIAFEYNLGALVFRTGQWVISNTATQPQFNTGISAYQIGWRGDDIEIFLANYLDSKNGPSDYRDIYASYVFLKDFKLSVNYDTENITSKAAYLAMLEWSKVKMAGDLAAKLGYGHYDVGFSPFYRDSDFRDNNFRAANNFATEGLILGASYGLEDSIEIGVTYMNKRTVVDQNPQSNLMLDLVAKF